MVLKTEHLVARTFSQRFSVAHFYLHTHMRVTQDVHRSCVVPVRTLKSSTHSIFHRPLFDVLDPCPSCCSTPPPSTPTALPMSGIRRSPCATPHGGLLFGYLAESTPLTGCEPKTCIDVSSEHTPINHPSRRDSFNIENNDRTTTVAASENSAGFQQQAVARSNQVW